MKTSRPIAMATGGMVASPHYLASLAGLRVLQDGGSAVDAAIAVNATLGIVYPHMTGMGGDSFWLIHDAQNTKLHALNGSGRTVAAASSVEPAVKARLADGARGGNRKGAAAVGQAIAERLKEQGITRVVFDRNGFLYHGRVRAVAEAARQAGLQF